MGVAAAIVGGSVIGGMIAGQQQADAQASIAGAQEREQRDRRSMAMAAAEPTPQEIAALEQSTRLNQQDIDRKQRILDSSDPAIIEAGRQALQLLQGQEAKSLDPIKRQRAKQREELQNRLRSQLGSGFENSTAGIQALSAFDEATDATLANAQQNSLAQLLGVAQDSSSRYGMQSNIANTGTIAGMYGNISNRRVGAINATPITAAGSQFVGDLQSARNMQNTFGQITTLGAMYMGGMFGGGGAAGGGDLSQGAGGGSYGMRGSGQTMMPG